MAPLYSNSLMFHPYHYQPYYYPSKYYLPQWNGTQQGYIQVVGAQRSTPRDIFATPNFTYHDHKLNLHLADTLYMILRPQTSSNILRARGAKKTGAVSKL